MSTPKTISGEFGDPEGSCSSAMGPPLPRSSWYDSPSSTAMTTLGKNQSPFDECSSDACTQNYSLCSVFQFSDICKDSQQGSTLFQFDLRDCNPGSYNCTLAILDGSKDYKIWSNKRRRG